MYQTQLIASNWDKIGAGNINIQKKGTLSVACVAAVIREGRVSKKKKIEKAGITRTRTTTTRSC